jgi:hypothetical protein
MYGQFADVAPLRANITIEDVGRTAVYLASDLSSAVTGEVIYVDGGFSVLGVQRRLTPEGRTRSAPRSARAGEVLRHRGVVDLRPARRQSLVVACRPSSTSIQVACARLIEDRLERLGHVSRRVRT